MYSLIMYVISPDFFVQFTFIFRLVTSQVFLFRKESFKNINDVYLILKIVFDSPFYSKRSFGIIVKDIFSIKLNFCWTSLESTESY